MAAPDLFKSAWENDVEAIRSAIDAGADPNEPHPHAGTLPLQLACQNNALEAIDILLGAGARADIVFSPASRVNGGVFLNRTPLMYVRSVEAAQRLLVAGARLEVADGNGWTALVWAAFAGSLPLVKLFLADGADPSVQPRFAGKSRSLCDFLKAVTPPASGAAETEAGRRRRSELDAVRDFLSNRSGSA